MDLLTILGLALGLAMDTFAVAMVAGLALPRLTFRPMFRLAWHFGFFQFMMPVLGWLGGQALERWVSAYDHWVAFGLLAAIGLKMLWEGRPRPGHSPEPVAEGDATRGVRLLGLSVATSIDALAVGVTLSLQRVSVWFPSVVIGVVAAGMTAVGMIVGRRVGPRFGRFAHLFGGLLLIAIGVRILVQHLTAR